MKKREDDLIERERKTFQTRMKKRGNLAKLLRKLTKPIPVIVSIALLSVMWIVSIQTSQPIAIWLIISALFVWWLTS